MRLFWIILVALSLSSCCTDLDKDKIRAELSKELQIGDTREKVELVLKRHRIDFSYYEEPERKYYANITGKNCAFDKSVIVDIYMDKSGRVSKIEVTNSYTFL